MLYLWRSDLPYAFNFLQLIITKWHTLLCDVVAAFGKGQIVAVQVVKDWMKWDQGTASLILNFSTGWTWLFLTLGERAPGSHWVGGLVGPVTGLDILERLIILCLYVELETVQPTTCLLHWLHFPEAFVCRM
jgi:hypothetical protein